MIDATDGRRYIVAAVVATEVPPTAPLAEFKAVIDVMRNRAASGRWGGANLSRTSWAALVHVVLAPHQFSAVCNADYWRAALAGEWQAAHVERCYYLLGEGWPDTTDGATHYYSPIGMPAHRVPDWAAAMREVRPDGVRPEFFRFFKP